MCKGWPVYSQQLVIMPNTQLEVGGKTTRGCISVVGNSSLALHIKGEKLLRWYCSANSKQLTAKNLLGCTETEQPVCILRQKLHQPNVIGPQRKGSAVGKHRKRAEDGLTGDSPRSGQQASSFLSTRCYTALPPQVHGAKTDCRQEKHMTFGNTSRQVLSKNETYFYHFVSLYQ